MSLERMLAIEHADRSCQVWRVDIGHVPSRADAALLCADETSRASRFVFERDRNRFINCRSALRRLLAVEAGSHARDLQILHGAHGKPILAADGPAFNVSHCADLALIAIATAPGDVLAVGVDLELARDVPDALALAPAVFTPQECADMANIDDSRRPLSFLTAWTRKEAYLKALGTGLANTEQAWTGIDAQMLSVERAWPSDSGRLQPARIELATHHLSSGDGVWSLALWRTQKPECTPGYGVRRIMETTA